MTTTKLKSWRDVLPIHPAALLLPRPSHDDLITLGNDIRAKGLIKPIVIYQERDPDSGSRYSLLDGISRLDAMEAVGLSFELKPNAFRSWTMTIAGYSDGSEPEPEITDTLDPYGFVISANIRRRHLTVEQRRDLIAQLLKATPEKSDRQIAETVKASPSTVGTVRKVLEKTGDVSNLDTRTDTQGRQQPAHKPFAAVGRTEARVAENQQAGNGVDPDQSAAARKTAAAADEKASPVAPADERSDGGDKATGKPAESEDPRSYAEQQRAWAERHNARAEAEGEPPDGPHFQPTNPRKKVQRELANFWRVLSLTTRNVLNFTLDDSRGRPVGIPSLSEAAVVRAMELIDEARTHLDNVEARIKEAAARHDAPTTAAPACEREAAKPGARGGANGE